MVYGQFDYYLYNPPQQPKAEIADYVESQGVRVPQRFKTFELALASGKDFILRSEHPDEYAGAAGLRKSHVVTKERLEKDKVNPARLISALDPGASFSYWEYVPGFNRAVVADTAIEGRYHITTSWMGTDRPLQSYVQLEKGVVTRRDGADYPADDFGELVEIYEKVRRLPRFDPNHCPIMEMQTREKKHYFLQYHRTRSVTPSTFTLTREPEADEVVAEFVRGATPPEGETLHFHVWPQFEPYTPVAFEEAGVDPPYASEFAEVMSRRRHLVVIDSTWKRVVTHLGGHEPRSSLFNPAISVVLPLGKLISSPGESESTIRVISDGRKAYLKRLP